MTLSPLPFRHSFIESFNENLLSTCYTKHYIKLRETRVNMIDMIPPFTELIVYGGDRQLKSLNPNKYITQIMIHAMREKNVL